MSVLRVGMYTEVYRPIRNGVVASVDALAGGLAARGIDVTCTAPRFPSATVDPAYVRRIASLPLPTKTGYRLVLPFARRDPTRTIVHAHSPFVSGVLAVRAARGGSVPLIFSYHTRLAAYAHYAPIDERLARAALAALARAYASACAAVVVPTRAIRDELRAAGVGARIVVVPTGVDVARLAGAPRDAAVRARLGARAGDPLVLWAGRLAPEKNVSLALRAFARLESRAARLAVVGDGISRERSLRLARDLGIADRTTFAGEADVASMPPIYAAADVLLFTSETETQGLVLSEARAAGLPIVAVDTRVTREVCGPRARLVPPSPLALATALAAVVAEPRPPRDVQPALGVDAAVDAMLAVYASCLDAAAAVPAP